MSASTTFGRWLVRRRQALGMTREALAQRLGYSVSSLRKVEADERLPSRQLVELLADHLQIDPADRPAFVAFARDQAPVEQVAPLPHAVVAVPSPSMTTESLPIPNLPIPLTPLVGREQELAALVALLRRADLRLLTLTGTAGAGKTRLALHAAADLWANFPDSLTFVDLAPVAHPDLVLPAVARALGLQPAGHQPLLTILIAYLRPRRHLLLLDNCEHLLPAAPFVADLLAACPHLTVLATSREPLRLRGEQEFPLDPLAIPDLAHLPDLPALAAIPAVALFLARAAEVRRGFTLDLATAPTVAAICCRLDGLPLALELAAARLRLFTPAALLGHLTDADHTPDAPTPLHWLTGGARDLPARHQTLRAAIAWSYQLLTKREQAFFRRLGVFAGGCSLPAAHAVAAPDDDEPTVVMTFESLVAKSLVTLVAGPEPRFTLLETLREYALEELVRSGEEAAVRRRHVDYFLAQAETACAEKHTRAVRRWLDWLDRESHNLRQVMRWAADHPADPAGLQLAGALGSYWLWGGYRAEVSDWLDATLSHPSSQPRTLLRARALDASGSLHQREADAKRAIDPLRKSISIYRERGSAADLALPLAHLGYATEDPTVLHESIALSRAVGDHSTEALALRFLANFAPTLEEMQRLSQASLAAAEQAEDDIVTATALGSLGDVEYRLKHFDQAEVYYHRALALAHALNVRWRIAYLVDRLALIALAREQYDIAVIHFEASIRNWRRIGEERYLAWMLYRLGFTHLYAGRPNEAARYFPESLRIGQARQDPIILGISVLARAALAEQAGDTHRAARLFGAAEAAWFAQGVSLWPTEDWHFDRFRQRLAPHLTDSALAAAYGEGRALTLDQALALDSPED